MRTLAYAAQTASSPLRPIEIERRAPGATDVAIDILFCGVCHSDLHSARGEWAGIRFPCVPGHEIVGRVSAVGSEVRKFTAGDIVGVGCMVDSCGRCFSCDSGEEQYCEHEQGFLQTYNGFVFGGGDNTFGGYSGAVVVDERFVLAVRHSEEHLAAVAPLLCAGITVWSPLREWRVGPGVRVGIVGIGGLGHMGVKIARALGAHVVAYTTSASKRDDALKLGAHEVVVSTDEEQMAAVAGRLDFILNTVAAPHDLDRFLRLLSRDGTMTLVGVPATHHPAPSVFELILRRRRLAGSLIGGIAQTQQMLDFCAEHGIVSDIETIAMADIENAYERMLRGDVKYRFVINMKTLQA